MLQATHAFIFIECVRMDQRGVRLAKLTIPIQKVTHPHLASKNWSKSRHCIVK